MLQGTEVLRELKENKQALKGNVLVVGNGFIACDLARSLKKSPEVKEVTILLPENEKTMNVPFEEKTILKAEGINILTVLKNLGEYHEVINAGELGKDERYDVRNQGSLETTKENIFVIGECFRGSSTMVQAVADGKNAAKEILKRAGLANDFARFRLELKPQDLYIAKGALRNELKTKEEGNRCLRCNDICEICTEVCPNRANVTIEVEGFENLHQIIHIDGMCNECGNCDFFCPHGGKPYKDKFTLYWTEEDYIESKNAGIVLAKNGRYIVRDNLGNEAEYGTELKGLDESYGRIAHTLVEKYPHYFLNPSVKE